MMSFWKKKSISNLNSDEYQKLLIKQIELSANINEVISKLKILETNYDNLRGNFNRKLSGIKKEEEKTENINTDGTVYLG
jgi:hypothetical protein